MEVTGITAAKASEIDGQHITGAVINELGNLTFSRKNNTTLNAGKVRPDPIENWPVDSVYISFDAANPAIKLKGGTWLPIGVGQMLVGVNPDDPDFASAGLSGGQKTVTLEKKHLPTQLGTTGTTSATHSHSGTTAGAGEHAHAFASPGVEPKARIDGAGSVADNTYVQSTTSPAGAHGHTFNTDAASASHAHAMVNVGGDQPHSVMSPYLTVYMWRRTK